MIQYYKQVLRLMLICMAIATTVHAQEKKYAKGTVKDELGMPLVNASVSERDRMSNATITDSAGRFFLELKGKAGLVVITYVGYEDQIVKASTENLAVQMKAAKGTNNEVVVVGYQNQKKRNVNGAITVLDGKEIRDIPATSFTQSLQGRIAGVSVLSSSGELGARPNIVIRGSTNVTYGSQGTSPLYVIDGVIYDVNAMGTAYENSDPLSTINPNNIESITVLKDASSAALYGARSGNGVIVVKTRKPKRGKPEINVNLTGGVTTNPRFIKVQGGALERQLKLRLLFDGGLPYNQMQNFANFIPIQLTDSLNPAFNNSTDWQGTLVQSNPLLMGQDVSMGGYFAGNSSYRFSLGHYSEQGIIKGYSYERINPNLNLSTEIAKNVTVNFNINFSLENKKHSIGGTGANLLPSWGFPSSFAQLDTSLQNRLNGRSKNYDKDQTFGITGTVNVNALLARGLRFNSTLSTNVYQSSYGFYRPKELNGDNKNYAEYTQNISKFTNFENTLAYEVSFGKHHLYPLLGAGIYTNNDTRSYVRGNGLTAGTHTVTGLGEGQSGLYGENYDNNRTTASSWANFSYDYNNRYSFGANLRGDMNSSYSGKTRAAIFPSFSAGWVVSDEKFFKPLSKVFNYFKVRASVGVSGLDPGNWYAKFLQVYTDASYYNSTTGTVTGSGTDVRPNGTPSTYNGTTVVGPFRYNNWTSSYASAASGNVRWQKDIGKNLGIEFQLFQNRISVVADGYMRDTKDIFSDNIVAQPTSGFLYYAANTISVRNQGLELSFNTQNLGPKSKFRWETGLNLSFNKNYITKLPNDNRDFIYGDPWWQKTNTYGLPTFNYLVFPSKGVFSTEADIPVDPLTGKKLTFFGTELTAGAPHFLDQNGDYVINNDDRVLNGNPLPKLTGGIRNTFYYKNFSLQIFGSFVLGRTVMNGYLSDMLNGSKWAGSWGTVAGPAAMGSLLNQFWQKPGDVTRFPRLTYATGTDLDVWNFSQSYFVENGSFFKITQIAMGYVFPEKFAKKMGLRFLRLNAQASNSIFLIKKSKILPDPEFADPTTGSVGGSANTYPGSIKLNFRLEASL